MDMQVVPEPGLTFSWLYRQVQQYNEQSIHPKASRLERWALGTGVAATAAGLTAGMLPVSVLPLSWALMALTACLAIEVSGFTLFLFLMLKREGGQYLRPRLSHAAEMDANFAYWTHLVKQLSAFPAAEREGRLRFVLALQKTMTDRMGLMYGGLQKLGPFPVLVALYLQFRTWTPGDWAGGFDVNPVLGLLIFSMVLLYALGWVLVGMRTRLDVYSALLDASLKDAPATAP